MFQLTGSKRKGELQMAANEQVNSKCQWTGNLQEEKRLVRDF